MESDTRFFATLATIDPLTTQDILNAVHIKYEQATDTPLLTDDDGKIRMSLINGGINRWETEDDTRWRELYVLNATAPTITAGTVAYELPQDDFREMGSRLRLLTTAGGYIYADVVTPEYYQQHMNGKGLVYTLTGNLAVSISGNRGNGYQLNLGWVPTVSDGTVGAVPYFDYYKWADRMETPGDIPEMSNPYFLIDYTTAELFVNDDVNLYEKFNDDATSKLDDMQTNNEALPPYASTAIENQSSSYAMG